MYHGIPRDFRGLIGGGGIPGDSKRFKGFKEFLEGFREDKRF